MRITLLWALSRGRDLADQRPIADRTTRSSDRFAHGAERGYPL